MSMIRTLLTYFRPHRKLFAIDLFCAIMVAVVDLAFPLVSRHAMYNMLPNQMFGVFFGLMATVAVFYMLRSLCYYFMTYIGHTFGVLVEADIRAALFNHLQELDFEFYDNNRTGKLMSRVTGDLFEITELAHHGPEDLLISVLTIVGSLTFMFTIEWRLALVVAVLIPIFLIIVMNRRRNMARASKEVKVRLAAINAEIETSISGIRTNATRLRRVCKRRFVLYPRRHCITPRQVAATAMGTFNASQEFFMCIMPVAVITFGGYLIMKGHLNYIDLITFTLFVNTFVTPIRKLSNFAEVFANGTAGLSRFMELMALRPNVTEKPDAMPLRVSEGDIRIEDISFAYNEKAEVIDHLNLHVHPGETVAVVGHSGGGKTTLCQLIPRFYEPTRGQVLVDDMDVSKLKLQQLRTSIGMATQDVLLYSDTIDGNIAYGDLNISKENVLKVSRYAAADEFISKMPDGYNTIVGERGVGLSGGQKQRISLARALAIRPSILILDDTTSAVDMETEKQIQKSLSELDFPCTKIIIAQRISTTKTADHILILQHGKITEQGTHDELIRKGGYYADLVALQTGKEEMVHG